jgi:hypothetical protein
VILIPSSRVRLCIEFDLDADPVSGILCDEQGGSEPFSGWMGLTGTIELALGAARRAASAPPEHESTSPPRETRR